jgi:hypothetical protein
MIKIKVIADIEGQYFIQVSPGFQKAGVFYTGCVLSTLLKSRKKGSLLSITAGTPRWIPPSSHGAKIDGGIIVREYPHDIGLPGKYGCCQAEVDADAKQGKFFQ